MGNIFAPEYCGVPEKEYEGAITSEGVVYATPKQYADNRTGDVGRAWLARARSMVRSAALSRATRCATADDIRPLAIGALSGCVFQTKDWQRTRQWVPSTFGPNHRRRINVWKYIGAGA